jgi:hypothetical protein
MTTLVVMDDGLNTNLIGDTLHINTTQAPLMLNQTSSNQTISNLTTTTSSNTKTTSANANSTTSSSKKKQHNCPFCDRSFTRPYRLNDHISFSHTDEVCSGKIYIFDFNLAKLNSSSP